MSCSREPSQPGRAIQPERAGVRNFLLRAGGEVIDSDVLELTVRYLDFRPGP